MNKLSSAISIFLLGAAGLSFAQSSPAEREQEPAAKTGQTMNRDQGADTSSSSGQSGTAGERASGGPATTEGNKALGTNIRGNANSANTSDRDTSRTWSGVGSTGGATGTGTSSGTTDDPPASRGEPGGSR